MTTQDTASSTAALKAFRTSRIRCWKLWEGCNRKVNSLETFSTNLLEIEEETLEFLSDLVTLTHLLQNLQRKNEDLNRKVSDSLEELAYLRIQRDQLEARINELVLLSNSLFPESLKIQPPWRMLCSSQVEEVYGPRIAGLVNRTLQTEKQAWELETVMKRFKSYCLGKQLQMSEVCWFILFQKRQCKLHILANTLRFVSETPVSEMAHRLENIHFRLRFKKQSIASCQTGPVKTNEYAMHAVLTFSVKRNIRTWNVFIEEDLFSELWLERLRCAYGSLTGSNDHPLVRIEIEPKLPQQNIRNLHNLLFKIPEKEIHERNLLILSELSTVFEVSETTSDSTSDTLL
ncbi:hypothetical protein Gasu2_54570 [Galdieria sulphuraria]|uniref:Uncharacterized protein n=1 Tax=Galdieria sulphuraria TaxID=130081 RepID=M2XBI3_GALSU|nr:uncharacterized protein Gasu_51170 [Galdieria sulphuraria]EME27257.1 hypothetical protein Gasu_51170 [Galdieria sulphuraria]GJD11317.1 hypothetical protein Gasu2_54570 [Galdieria sulphuraria]|eukprot:XP_005703777.1 hypothetical protein Gasu_51170 [Galdieria sulphuraria]